MKRLNNLFVAAMLAGITLTSPVTAQRPVQAVRVAVITTDGAKPLAPEIVKALRKQRDIHVVENDADAEIRVLANRTSEGKWDIAYAFSVPTVKCVRLDALIKFKAIFRSDKPGDECNLIVSEFVESVLLPIRKEIARRD